MRAETSAMTFDCVDIGHKTVRVVGSDPYGFDGDGDGDGLGCDVP